jgi:hypothetical protein
LAAGPNGGGGGVVKEDGRREKVIGLR